MPIRINLPACHVVQSLDDTWTGLPDPHIRNCNRADEAASEDWNSTDTPALPRAAAADECAELECPVFQPSSRDRTRRGFRCVVVEEGGCLHPSYKICLRRHEKLRACSSPVSFEGSLPRQSSNRFSSAEEYEKDSSVEPVPKPLSKEELQTLLADSERQKLAQKLSEANQQNRFLKRQLHVKEDALVNCKKEVSVMELELQALVSLAEEIANLGIPEGTRKINGKYIQSHLLSRLEAMQEKLKEQIKDVEAAESKEVPLCWCGMAESVQVMGNFDGWSEGEHLSPEYTDSYTKFSTTLMLRPGRYEIKFLVDGEWTLSPEFPTVGEGLMKNNLLVVD